MIEEKKIRYILAINDHRNITKASEAMYISQPALSRILLDTEKELGTPLFIRDHGTLHLTHAGEIYIDACQQVLRTYSSARRKIQDLTDPDRGRIILAMTSVLADCTAPVIIREFSEKYPQTRLLLTEEKASEIEEMVRTGKADIGLTYRNDESDLDHIPVFRDEIVVIAPGTGTGELRTISVHDLQGQDVILLKKGRRVRQQTDAILEKYHVTPNVILETDSLRLCIEMAMNGQGYTFTPKILLRTLKAYDDAVQCVFEEERIDRTLYMISRKDTYFSQAMTSIQEIIRHACTDMHSY